MGPRLTSAVTQSQCSFSAAFSSACVTGKASPSNAPGAAAVIPPFAAEVPSAPADLSPVAPAASVFLPAAPTSPAPPAAVTPAVPAAPAPAPAPAPAVPAAPAAARSSRTRAASPVSAAAIRASDQSSADRQEMFGEYGEREVFTEIPRVNVETKQYSSVQNASW